MIVFQINRQNACQFHLKFTKMLQNHQSWLTFSNVNWERLYSSRLNLCFTKKKKKKTGSRCLQFITKNFFQSYKIKVQIININGIQSWINAWWKNEIMKIQRVNINAYWTNLDIRIFSCYILTICVVWLSICVLRRYISSLRNCIIDWYILTHGEVFNSISFSLKRPRTSV